jgi:hypothetical protein
MKPSEYHSTASQHVVEAIKRVTEVEDRLRAQFQAQLDECGKVDPSIQTQLAILEKIIFEEMENA